eukprot:TRINITY_DN8422_c0_g1_i1.p1 TRINITY_DN8422_c0_g1~~TRINITY_DN8422_c0_g1_i1.p1  ORF type:complete len:312 (+),score=100.50 TRINITY_DN8422_c0_g1_i1:46-936(+)
MSSKKQMRKNLSIKPPPENSKKRKKMEPNENKAFVDNMGDRELSGEEDLGGDFGGGYKLEAFNLREERERGAFKDGHYVEEDEKYNDPWITQYDESQIQKFKEESQKRRRTEESDEEEEIDVNKLRGVLVKHLLPKENTIRALKRLGAKKGHKTDEANQKAFDEVTEAADTLINSGHYDIYNETREKIESHIKAELDMFSGEVTEIVKDDDQEDTPLPNRTVSFATPSENQQEDDTRWEYKTNEEVFGPYTTNEIRTWWSQGWFQNNEVYFRKMVDDAIFEEEWEPATKFADVFGQ